MTTVHIPWKKQDWAEAAAKVVAYFKSHPDLKYGPRNENKAIPVLDHLCKYGSASRAYLNEAYRLTTDDAMLTILSNVTMAIQGSGSVSKPEDGGWYTSIDAPYTYVVAPGFCAAWNSVPSS